MGNETSVAASSGPRLAHIASLDGLRGLAVLLVLWWHLPEDLLGAAGSALRFVLQPGYLGVDLFFVLSGFLITRILLDEKSRGVHIGGFLVRRIARIFPAYYLLLAIIACVAPATNGLWWSALYLSNVYFAFDPAASALRHTWSLAVEEHFYLLWPWAVFALSVNASRRIIVQVLLPLAILLAVLTAWLEPAFGYEADALIYRITCYRMLSLGAGALIAYHEAALRSAPRLLLGWAAALGACGVVLLPLATLVDHRWIGPIMLVGFTCISVLALLAALWLEWHGGRLSTLLNSAMLTQTGRISYGLYLYHFPIFIALGVVDSAPDSPSSGWLRPLAALVLSYGVAWLSFTWFEKPIQDAVRRRIKIRRTSLTATAA